MTAALRAVAAPPHDLEAEEAVLGACLAAGPRATHILAPLSIEDFYAPKHQTIASAIHQLLDLEQPVDLVTVTDQLRRNQQLDAIGGAHYLAALIASCDTPANATHHAQIVANLATRRLLQTALLEAQQRLDTGNLDDILDRLAGHLHTTRQLTGETKLPTSYLEWPLFWDTDHQEAEWLFDDILAKGRAHVIYADAKAGKSLLTLFMSLRLVHAGHVVIYLDYEQTEDDLYERLSDFGAGPGQDLERFRYALLPTLPPLDTADGGRAVAALVDDAQRRWPDRHVLVVVDTMSRAVEGEENSADTVRAFYRHTGMLLKQRGTTWVRLDHAGKDGTKGQRGTSAKRDDVDVVWKLTAGDMGGLNLKREAARMGWVPEKVTLHRRDEPIMAFVRVSQGWPAGTKDAAEILDRIGVPIDAHKRGTRELLRAAGVGMRENVLSAALRWRREQGPTG